PFGEAMQQLLTRMAEQNSSCDNPDPALGEKIKKILPSVKHGGANEKQLVDLRERATPAYTPRTDPQACAALFSARGQAS
ncbi:MAG: hypothetical protein KDE19_06280, partial [Caldilineaceae bacterium]|nr:hypothetical protein [Caldilineaceae bacterium]